MIIFFEGCFSFFVIGCGPRVFIEGSAVSCQLSAIGSLGSVDSPERGSSRGVQRSALV